MKAYFALVAYYLSWQRLAERYFDVLGCKYDKNWTLTILI